MSTKKTAAPSDAAALSYVDPYGATVTVAAGEARTYADIKTEHLTALTRLVMDIHAGDVELEDSQADIFITMLNGVAHEVQELIGIVASDTKEAAGGGE